MNIDAEFHLGEVGRSVSRTELDGSPADAVELTRGFDTPVENLWDAVTSGERIRRWFLPVSGDLRQGGRYQLEGNAGGLIAVCEPSSHFILTWEFGGDVSRVEVRLSSEGDGLARLALTHTARHSEFWDTYGPGAVGVGWEMGMLGLWIHITQPDQPMPDEAAFAASPEGRAMITGSSEGWRQAAVTAGTDVESATAAASRTTAFYTGEAPKA